jgi:hypothetical protein
MRLLLGVLLAVVIGVPAEASAQARKILNRARRKVAVGPVVGTGVIASSDGADGLITFGLAVFTFKDPLMDPKAVEQMVKERLKRHLKERIKAQLTGSGDTEARVQAELEAGGDALQQLKEEIRAEVNREPDKTPKPQFDLGIEGGYAPRGEAWMGRFWFGFGIGPVSLSAGPAVIHSGDADETGFAVAGELGYYWLPGRGPRSPAIEIFLRGDFMVAGDLGSSGTLGVRLMLDII